MTPSEPIAFALATLENGALAVAGVSSSGKSTFIRAIFDAAPPDRPPFFVNGMRQTREGPFEPGPGMIIHLDIFGARDPADRQSPPRPEAHRLFGLVSGPVPPAGAVVLCADPGTLRARMQARDHRGAGFDYDEDERPYRRAVNLRLLDDMPLSNRYAPWLAHFIDFGVPICLVRSTGGGYARLPSVCAANIVLIGKT